jgi:hypothetical protein
MNQSSNLIARFFHPYNLVAVLPVFAIVIPIIMTPVPLVPNAQAGAAPNNASTYALTPLPYAQPSSDPSLLHSEPNAYVDEGVR